MKKYLLRTGAVLLLISLLSSCGKECICTASYITVTQDIKKTYEMGEMSEDECLKYNRNIQKDEEVTYIVDCKSEK